MLSSETLQSQSHRHFHDLNIEHLKNADMRDEGYGGVLLGVFDADARTERGGSYAGH